MTADPFSSREIQERIAEKFCRIRSRWLDMVARSEFPAGLDEELIGILVETLDAYAECCLEGVSDRATFRQYCALLPNRWAGILAEQEKSGPLAPSGSLGVAPASNHQSVQPADPAQHEAWRNGILDVATERVEARYFFWEAEARRRLREVRLGTKGSPGRPGDVAASSSATPEPTLVAESGGETDNANPASWDMVEIMFLTNDLVLLSHPPGCILGYREMGFGDGRTGKPNRAWLTLRELAANAGTMRRSRAETFDKKLQEMRNWSKVEKRMQEIRRTLRDRFGIAADPIPLVDGTKYEARFKIRYDQSFKA
jgi:hypothetical protein